VSISPSKVVACEHSPAVLSPDRIIILAMDCLSLPQRSSYLSSRVYPTRGLDELSWQIDIRIPSWVDFYLWILWVVPGGVAVIPQSSLFYMRFAWSLIPKESPDLTSPAEFLFPQVDFVGLIGLPPAGFPSRVVSLLPSELPCLPLVDLYCQLPSSRVVPPVEFILKIP
jgi:hypothetical protein